MEDSQTTERELFPQFYRKSTVRSKFYMGRMLHIIRTSNARCKFRSFLDGLHPFLHLLCRTTLDDIIFRSFFRANFYTKRAPGNHTFSHGTIGQRNVSSRLGKILRQGHVVLLVASLLQPRGSKREATRRTTYLVFKINHHVSLKYEPPILPVLYHMS